MSLTHKPRDLTIGVTIDTDGVQLWIGTRNLTLHPNVAARLAEELAMAVAILTRSGDATYVEPEVPNVH